MDGVRINKYLAERGICSRREADGLIGEGRVTVNGVRAGAGQRVMPEDTVAVDGRAVARESSEEPVLLAFHKPVGIVCTSSDRDRAENIIDFIGYGSRIFTIGRLDKDSRGLILLTNRGELVNAVGRAANRHEKEYIVRCRDRISDMFLERLRHGVPIRVPGRETDPATGEKKLIDVTTRKAKVTRLDDYSFDIVLTQGYNRQIRRMCAALGNKVVDLQRIRVMNILLGDLPEGQWRRVTGKELKAFEDALVKKANTPK